MTERTYSLEFKICIIKELLKQTMELQKIYEENPECFGEDFWTWQQSQRCVLITVLDILNDDLSCIAKETINNAHEVMDNNNQK